MFKCEGPDPLVGIGLVREERGPFCGVFVHEALQRGLVGVIDHASGNLPRRAVLDACNGGLTHGTTSSFQLLPGVFVAFLAADKG